MVVAFISLVTIIVMVFRKSRDELKKILAKETIPNNEH